AKDDPSRASINDNNKKYIPSGRKLPFQDSIASIVLSARSFNPSSLVVLRSTDSIMEDPIVNIPLSPLFPPCAFYFYPQCVRAVHAGRHCAVRMSLYHRALHFRLRLFDRLVGIITIGGWGKYLRKEFNSLICGGEEGDQEEHGKKQKEKDGKRRASSMKSHSKKHLRAIPTVEMVNECVKYVCSHEEFIEALFCEIQAILSWRHLAILTGIYCTVEEFTTEEELYQFVESKHLPIFVKFYEDWCIHCKSIEKTFNSRAQAASLLATFINVDCSSTEEAKAFCSKHHISYYPTFKLFNGEWIEYYKSSLDERNLGLFLRTHKKLQSYDLDAIINNPIPKPTLESEPIETKIIPSTFTDIQNNSDPKIIVFGNIYEEATQQAYRNIEEALVELGDTFPYDAFRVEQTNNDNDSFYHFFIHNAERAPDLPLLFVITPLSEVPQPFLNYPITSNGLVEFIEYILIEPDMDKVLSFEKSQKIIDLSHDIPVFVVFTEYWCDHCTALLPHFAKAAMNFSSDEVAFVKVDCSQNRNMRKFCRSIDMDGYPTMMMLIDGKWKKEYKKDRSSVAITKYVKKIVEKSKSKKNEEETFEEEPILELLNDDEESVGYSEELTQTIEDIDDEKEPEEEPEEESEGYYADL
ncbi:hypothetical protein ADUPG1_008156, partial [Aduncisulcus paluster]